MDIREERKRKKAPSTKPNARKTTKAGRPMLLKGKPNKKRIQAKCKHVKKVNMQVAKMKKKNR